MQGKEVDEAYMRRCLELAKLGLGEVQPNPMVGAVIVHNGRIIGEGYHHRYGESHAEVNAINSVEDKALLKESTIYVSLEPCSHYGKTPPCADKLIEMGIPRVVIGATDPHDKVNGKGIAKLEAAGIEVTTGVLREACEALNCRFFTYHRLHRPYIILKWAQTADGYMDIDRTENPNGKYWITNEEMRVLVHKWRSEEQAILVGYRTFENDHPQLTNRLFPGKNPKRYLMARQPEKLTPVDGFTLISNNLQTAMQQFYEDKIESVIVEGGRKTLDHFIAQGLWDEARILTGGARWCKGVAAPHVSGAMVQELTINGNLLQVVKKSCIFAHK